MSEFRDVFLTDAMAAEIGRCRFEKGTGNLIEDP